MNRSNFPSRQRGVITIFIAMIMLLLITLLVATAFRMSTTNLRAVGNVQVRDEGIAAAQKIIEQIILEDATLAGFQTARTDLVDINMDGTDDYTVDTAVPLCVRATQVNTETVSSETLPGFSAGGAWNTVWELRSTATEVTSGASVLVVHAVRYLMTDTEKAAVCA